MLDLARHAFGSALRDSFADEAQHGPHLPDEGTPPVPSAMLDRLRSSKAAEKQQNIPPKNWAETWKNKWPSEKMSKSGGREYPSRREADSALGCLDKPAFDRRVNCLFKQALWSGKEPSVPFPERSFCFSRNIQADLFVISPRAGMETEVLGD